MADNVISKIKLPDNQEYILKDSNAARSNHTHDIALEKDTSGTNQLTLAAGTKYKLTAGGESYIFTTPADANNKVTIAADTTTNANYPLVFGSTNTGTTTAKTEGLQKSTTKFYVNPSTGNIQATTFNGIALTAAAGKSITDNSSNTDVTSSDTNLITGRTLYYQLAKKGYTTNTGTVTNVATGAGLTGGPIATTGTIKANLTSDDKLANAAADGTETAGRVYPVRLDKNGKLAVNVPWVDRTYTQFTGNPTSNQTPAFGSTFTIQQISQTTTGQVSGTDRTVTIPGTIAANNTKGLIKPWYNHTKASTGPTAGSDATAVAVNAISNTAGKYYAVEIDSDGRLFANVPWTDTNTHHQAKLIIGATSTATANAAVTANSLYANVIENSSVRSSNNIVGSGSVTVSSDANGKITITGTKSGTVTSITPGNGLLNGTGTGAITTSGTLNINYGTSASEINGEGGAAGTANTVSRSDHVHKIEIDEGTNNGEISIAGVTVKPKGIAALAYKASLVAGDIPNLAWSKITSGKPTTLSGYGITDAKIDAGVITLGSNTIKPVTSVNGHSGSSVNVTAGDLGLSSALRYVGKTTSTMSESFTGVPAGISGYTKPIVGDVVLDSAGNGEYVCVGVSGTTYTWESLGPESSFKKVQTAVTKPDAVTNKWVSAIGQNTNGAIDVSYTTLDTSGTWSGSAGSITSLTTSDKASNTDTWRYVWFSYNDLTRGRPAYSDKLVYQTSTNTLKIDTGTLTATQYSGNAATATTATNLSTAPTITKTGTSTIDLTANTTYTLAVGGQSVIFKTPADSDTKVTLAAITSGTAYYPVVGTGTGNAQRQIDTTGFAYKGTNGTTSAVGAAELTLGNSTASGTANNKQGKLTLYGSTAYTHTLLGAPTSARTITLPDATGTVELTSHIHGNLTHDGKITSTATIANGDKLVIVDSDTTAGGKITGSTITFDGSTTTKALTQKGTWETFNNYSHPTGDGNLHVPVTGTTHNGQVLKAGSTAGSISWGTLSASDVGALAAGGNAVSATTATNLSAAPTITATGTATVNLAANTTYTLTVGGKSVVFKTPSDANTNTLVNYTLGETTKAYLMASQNAPTTTTTARAAHGDTGVYLTATAGEFSAVRHSYNVAGVERAYTHYNMTDQSIDFVFV